MFQDFYLKFPDEVTANNVLYDVTPAVLNEDNVEVQAEYATPKYINIDVLGVLYEKPPEPLPEDYVPVALDGWHVNVRVMPDEDPAPLVPYSVVPSFPRRIWG